MLVVVLQAAVLLGTAASPDTALDRLAACVDRADTACTATALRSLDANAYSACAACQETEARAWLLLRRKEEAIRAIHRALQLDPGNYTFLMTQGLIHQRFDDHIPAIQSFLLAGRLQPRNPSTYYSLGMSFFLLKEYERAQRHFRHVVELDPAHHRSEMMLGITEAFNSRAAEARAHLEKAIALQPDTPYYHLYLGIVLDKFTDDRAGALRELELAARLGPSYAFTRYNLGVLYARGGKRAEARRELEEAVRLSPALTRAWYQLAMVTRVLGDRPASEKAMAEFKRLQAAESQEPLDPVESTIAPK